MGMRTPAAGGDAAARLARVALAAAGGGAGAGRAGAGGGAGAVKRPGPGAEGGAGKIRAVGMDLGSRDRSNVRGPGWGRRPGDRPADQQRRPDHRRPARGPVPRRGLRDVPGQPCRRRAPHAPRPARDDPPPAGEDRQQRVDLGYAHLPGASTYAASKAGVVALTQSLRRELRGTGVSTLHLVTPGVATDMLDATQDVYGRHMDTSGWENQAPDDWAEKVVAAVLADRTTLQPGGKVAWAVRASRAGGPARP